MSAQQNAQITTNPSSDGTDSGFMLLTAIPIHGIKSWQQSVTPYQRNLMVRRLAHTMVAYVRNMEYGIYEMANSRFEYRLLLDEGFCRTPKELEEQRQKRKEQQSMEAFAKMLTQKLNIVSTKNAVTVSAASDQSAPESAGDGPVISPQQQQQSLLNTPQSGSATPNVNLPLGSGDDGDAATSSRTPVPSAAASLRKSISNLPQFDLTGEEDVVAQAGLVGNIRGFKLPMNQVKAIPSQATKTWHQEVMPDYRNHVVRTLVYIMVTYARKLEGRIYEMAKRHRDYYHLLNDEIATYRKNCRKE